jgi:aldehyde dehydrogenase (NAD+)
MAEPLQLTAPNGTKYTQPTGKYIYSQPQTHHHLKKKNSTTNSQRLQQGLFINNEFVPATSGEKIETINPYDESVIATVEAAGEKDVDAAVAAARAAFKTGSEWRNLTPQERGVLLWKLGDLCKRDEAILATIDAWDNGKGSRVLFWIGGEVLMRVRDGYAGADADADM